MSRRRLRPRVVRPDQRSLTFEPLEPRQMLDASSLVPLAGDWDGDGVDSLGSFERLQGNFLLRNENSSGFAQTEVRFGPQNGDLLPLVGDWDGDGDDTPGLYDARQGKFFLKNSLEPGAADVVFRFGRRGDDVLPISGDWDGNGRDGVGLYRPAGGNFFLKNTLRSGPAEIAYRYGPQNDNWLPVSGDWDGDGNDSVGLYDRESGKYFLKNAVSPGVADEVFRFGPRNNDWLPLAADWDGNGSITIGLHDSASGLSYLRDSLTAGPADTELLVVAALDTISPPPAPLPPAALTAVEVEMLLERAAAASASDDAIIAIVDRGGTILGVRAEEDVLTTIPDTPTRVFAIDGAVAKARTAAFFANDTAPLTSRLIRFVSQSTVTQREVEANPNSADPLVRGPGFVAPVGLGGHFPPGVPHTPVVNLFAIEHTNRDSLVHPGPDLIKGTPDDIPLPSRFNVDPAFIPDGQETFAPESYGFVSGLLDSAQSRGIATLPGGVPLYKDLDGDGRPDALVGGVGVFFPGPDGFATHEQDFIPGIGQTEAERTNADQVLEAEWIAFATAGGTLDVPVGDLNGVAPVAGIQIPATSSDRLTLAGIELEIFGPHPDGLWTVLEVGQRVVGDDPTAGQSGEDFVVDGTSGALYLDGQAVPQGWLVLPHASEVDDLSAADVNQMITSAVEEANLVRAAIRLPLGSRTKMVMSVADTDGNVLGLFRMADATFFSIDVAVAKARNTAYYADPTALQVEDQIDGVPVGTAFTNRTFRFVAEPRFPDGVDGTAPSPFSILNDPGTNPRTAENIGPPAPAISHTSVLGFDAFNPGSNFRDPDNIANQNGIVFFPGSTPIYSGVTLIGGFGVSGDGVDQDDVVTFFGAQGFLPPSLIRRADQAFVRGVRLPFIKFLRNPEG